MKKYRIGLICVMIAASGCFRQAVVLRDPLPDIVWPKHPEIARVRFVNSISMSNDFNIEEGTFKKIFRFLSGSREKDGISSPYGIESDMSGRLFVVDSMKRCVHVFEKVNGVYYTFPNEGISFVSPIDIAIDGRGYIYVTDSTDAVVRIFKDNGKKYVRSLGDGVLKRPTGIAINHNTEELLVVDTGGAVVVRYNLTDYQLKGVIGGKGKEFGRFHSPTNISVSRDGYIFISDSLNSRVQVFTPDGKFIQSIGKPGDSPGYFSRPRGIAVDSDMNIYVVDALFDNIQVFDKDGRLLMSFGAPGKNYGEFWLPSGIFIDQNDYIYISDTYNNRVQIFQYLKLEEHN